MRPANSRKCAENLPLMNGQKPDIRFVRTPFMCEDVPVGCVKICGIYAFSVLRYRPQRIAKFLNVAGNPIEIAYDLPDELCVDRPVRSFETAYKELHK